MYAELDAKTAVAQAVAVSEELGPIGDDALVGEMLRRREALLEGQGIVQDAERLCRLLTRLIAGEPLARLVDQLVARPQ